MSWQLGISLVFQSTPDLINRENLSTRFEITGVNEFQSTPDLINRENKTQQQQQAHQRSFNPLPI